MGHKFGGWAKSELIHLTSKRGKVKPENRSHEVLVLENVIRKRFYATRWHDLVPLRISVDLNN
jgi:hypothetical protein